MAKWYSITDQYAFTTYFQSSVGSNVNISSVRFLPFDFVVNDVVYNKENLPISSGILTQIWYGTPNSILRLRYAVGGSYRDFFTSGVMRGRCRVCRSFDETDIFNSEYFIELPTTTIKGKYKFRQTIDTLPNNLIRQGTIPINVLINNKKYNNIVFTDNYGLYFYDRPFPLDNNGYAFGAYSNPINLEASGSHIDESFTSFTNNSGNNDNTIKTEFVGITLDFGDIPQEVPQLFADWVNANFDFIYSNSYIINTNTSDLLTSVNEAPPMKRANLYYLGSYKKLTMVGINDQEYILEWESEPQEGKAFGGLSLSTGNGPIYIPSNGEDTDINLENSTNLYESYQTYRPLEDPFTIMLYKNSSEPHRVDKTDFLTEVGGYSGIFRDSANIVNPIIRVQANDIPNFNYVKIGILNRYYFVTDYDIVRTGLIDLYLTEDVLMTYREGIYKLQAFIDRNQYANNPYLVDKKRVIEEGVNVETHSIENDIMSDPLLQPDTDIRFVMNGYKIASWGITPI